MGFDTINGRAFIGNTPTFRAKVGETVQWDVLALGENFHVFHVHGHRWLRNGVPTDSELLGPSSTLKVRWREDAPGVWFWHCHVESHQDNGMVGLYRVSLVIAQATQHMPPAAPAAPAPRCARSRSPTPPSRPDALVVAPGHRGDVAQRRPQPPHRDRRRGARSRSAPLFSGDEFTISAPATPGVYAYHCRFHAYIRGTLTVSLVAPRRPRPSVRVGRTATLSGTAPGLGRRQPRDASSGASRARGSPSAHAATDAIGRLLGDDRPALRAHGLPRRGRRLAQPERARRGARPA